ncbi:MAG: mevalonate kinase [Candidatus Aminicenantaceae bacterium]
MEKGNIVVSAPGRLCLLGEHQDYFGLSIIAAAVNLRIRVSGKKRQDQIMRIDLPDINQKEEFPLDKELPYEKKRDYLKSSVNILRRKGVVFSSGFNCQISGNIPINSGSASSSALVVAWIKFLLEAAKDNRAQSNEKIAELAYSAEVAEFKEPGGKMDHYTSSLGNIVYIDFRKDIALKRFKKPLKEFVLADSLQRKDTTGMLQFIKTNVYRGLAILQKKFPHFHLRSYAGKNIMAEIEKLPAVPQRLLKGTLLTKNITKEGLDLFNSKGFDHDYFGKLLLKQYELQRDHLQISTDKLNKMIDQSLEAGALGAKINGSGAGGCMFAYAPNKAEKVKKALERLGTKATIIQVDEGACTISHQH